MERGGFVVVVVVVIFLNHLTHETDMRHNFPNTARGDIKQTPTEGGNERRRWERVNRKICVSVHLTVLYPFLFL